MSADPHLITYYELTYWNTGKYPTNEQVIEQFGYTKEEFAKEFMELLEPLKTRGLPIIDLEIPSTTPVKKKKLPENLLDPIFVLAAGQILDTVDKRATAAKLKALGMSTAQWKAMLRIPENREYFEKRLKNSMMGDVALSADLALARNVEAGDLQSVKYFNEYQGRYRPDAGLGMNVGILIGRFMEILSRRLTPEVMLEIADEFDAAVIETSTKELSA